MTYRQNPYQHARMGSRNQERLSVGSAQSYNQFTASNDYPIAQSNLGAPAMPYNLQAAPAMSYTSSTDSNNSAYTASSISSMSSSPRRSSDFMPMPPSNYPKAGYEGSLPRYDTVGQGAGISSPAKSSRSSRKQTPERSGGDRFVCLYPGCTSSFSRPADLSRHQHSVHLRDQHLIDCPKHRCSRKGENGFTRQDHLSEHLRQYHGEKVEKRPSSRSHRTSSVNR